MKNMILDFLFMPGARKSAWYELQTSTFCGVDQNSYQKVLHLFGIELVLIYVAFPTAVHLI